MVNRVFRQSGRIPNNGTDLYDSGWNMGLRIVVYVISWRRDLDILGLSFYAPLAQLVRAVGS